MWKRACGCGYVTFGFSLAAYAIATYYYCSEELSQGQAVIRCQQMGYDIFTVSSSGKTPESEDVGLQIKNRQAYIYIFDKENTIWIK